MMNGDLLLFVVVVVVHPKKGGQGDETDEVDQKSGVHSTLSPLKFNDILYFRSLAVR